MHKKRCRKRALETRVAGGGGGRGAGSGTHAQAHAPTSGRRSSERYARSAARLSSSCFSKSCFTLFGLTCVDE